MLEKIKSLEVNEIERIRINTLKEELKSSETEKDSFKNEVTELKQRICDLEQKLFAQNELNEEQSMETDDVSIEQDVHMDDTER